MSTMPMTVERIVIATSNGATGLSKPLLQRFNPKLMFQGGPGLKRAGQERLVQIWKAEAGDRPMPAGWLDWGCDDENEFSMRVAIDELETALDMYAMAQHLVGGGV